MQLNFCASLSIEHVLSSYGVHDLNRPRLTTEIYRDILQSLAAALNVLDEDKPTQDEKAASESIQYVLRSTVHAITLELQQP